MTTVERFDDGSGSWVEIENYGSFQIENGVSDVLVAPTATLELQRTASVAAGTRIRIREGTTDTFEGNVTKTKPRTRGPMRVEAEHDAYGLFEDTATLSVTGTDEDVLNAALSASSGTWTLAYAGTATTLGDTYACEGRPIKRIFRDMVDRTGRVWWVDVDHTIHVEPLGAQGVLATVDTATDAAVISEYTPDDVDTVVNDVTVLGTGGEQVTGTDSDATSISTYGRQPERVNVDYIRSAGEADAYASELLNPDPDASATGRLGASVGDVASPIVNAELDVTDTQGTGLNDTLVIEKQTVTQGSAEVDLGEGAGVNVAKFNRREKSKGDTTEPGSVYNTDRLADDAVSNTKLVDLSVTEQKLADLAVAQEKLQNNAVVNGKLADLSVSETKVQDDSISTPKLVAEAVTAAKIEADTITAAEIAAGAITAEEIEAFTITGNEIAARTISAINIEADALTANEIDTLDLDTDQLTIGDPETTATIDFDVDGGVIRMIPDGSVAIGTQSLAYSFGAFQTFEAQTIQPTQGDDTGNIGAGDAYSEIHAYDFIDASTGSSITDGGDPRAGVADGHGPPDHAAVTDDEGNQKGYSINRMARDAWDVIREQDRVIRDLEARVAELEAAVDPNA